LALASLSLAGPALAQKTPGPAGSTPNTAAPQDQNAKTPPDPAEAFLTGLRRVGVVVGQVFVCSTDKDRPAQIAQAMQLANYIAIDFGLKSAFDFVGAVGYGSGHPFDKAGCGQAMDEWKQIQAKYLNK
jgi:hypothetical protein